MAKTRMIIVAQIVDDAGDVSMHTVIKPTDDGKLAIEAQEAIGMTGAEIGEGILDTFAELNEADATSG